MKETTLEIDGKSYRLAALDREVGDKFLAWADSVLPNPLEVVASQVAKFPQHLQELLVKDALASAKCKRTLTSPEVQSLMGTPDGAVKIIGLLFRKHQPDLTDEQAWDVFQAGIDQHGDDFMQAKLKEATGQKG